MKKNLIAFVIALVFLATLLTGCANNDSDTAESTTPPKADDKETVSEAPDTADTDEVVKLNALFIAHPLTKSVDEMQWLSEIEEKAGVEVEWEQIYSDWETTKPTRFASGDIPEFTV